MPRLSKSGKHLKLQLLVGDLKLCMSIQLIENILKLQLLGLISEGKVKTSNSGVVVRDNFYGSLEDDVFRRDFTVNGLYYDLVNVLYDYVNGISDIENKKLRLIKKPSVSYQEDPVRMLRAIKFESKLKLELQ